MTYNTVLVSFPIALIRYADTNKLSKKNSLLEFTVEGTVQGSQSRRSPRQTGTLHLR